ncbi:MAG: pirin family protein [Phycisphaerales bacterium]
MITIRKAETRGTFDHGWLKTAHTFSFGRYVDREHVQFRALRVINDDVIAPGRGFGQHPHDNMEIITVVLAGRLAHRDTLGNVRELRPGMAQVMSAGEGIEHSEFNPSSTEPTHLYQIWIIPDQASTRAGYTDLHIPPATDAAPLRTIASADGRDGSAKINSDATVHITTLGPGRSAAVALPAGRHAYVQVLRGSIELNGHPLSAGDGAAVSDEATLTLSSSEGGEALVFELA